MRPYLIALPVLLAACSSGSDAPPQTPVETPCRTASCGIPPDIPLPTVAMFDSAPENRAAPSPFDPGVSFDTAALISVDGSAGVTLRLVNGSQGPMRTTVCNVAAIRDNVPVGRGVASWPGVVLPGESVTADAVFAGLSSQADYDYAEWACSWS